MCVLAMCESGCSSSSRATIVLELATRVVATNYSCTPYCTAVHAAVIIGHCCVHCPLNLPPSAPPLKFRASRESCHSLGSALLVDV
jgi:hypothetical protein